MRGYINYSMAKLIKPKPKCKIMAHTYYYHLGPQYKPIKIGPFNTSKVELTHLCIAWIAISFAFANILRGADITYLQALILSAITVGTGFFLHELGHKVVAQKFGCFAEFRAFFTMLVFAVALSFTGFVFAAPGAVMITGRPGPKQNGLISLAGPLINLILAFIFMVALVFAVLLNASTFFAIICAYGITINTWLALFNLLPFANFDGVKIYAWNKGIYFTAMGFTIVLFILQRFSF